MPRLLKAALAERFPSLDPANALLSHADRRRVFPEAYPSLYEGGRLGIGHVLVDGTLQATWRLDRPRALCRQAIDALHDRGWPQQQEERVPSLGISQAYLCGEVRRKPSPSHTWFVAVVSCAALSRLPRRQIRTRIGSTDAPSSPKDPGCARYSRHSLVTGT